MPDSLLIDDHRPKAAAGCGAAGLGSGLRRSGAAVFLASPMAMPLTAILLTIELARVHHDMRVPILLAGAGSAATSRLFAKGGIRVPGRAHPL